MIYIYIVSLTTPLLVGPLPHYITVMVIIQKKTKKYQSECKLIIIVISFLVILNYTFWTVLDLAVYNSAAYSVTLLVAAALSSAV